MPDGQEACPKRGRAWPRWYVTSFAHDWSHDVRKRKQKIHYRRPQGRRKKVTVTITGASPECPGGARAGLDGIVYFALKKVNQFVEDMRINISVPNQAFDEASAVERYLAYVCVLVDIVLSEMAISAIHGNDIAVLMQQRMLVEYAAKAQYYNDFPDYALFMMTIGEAHSIYKKVKMAGGDPKIINDLKNDYDAKVSRFASVAHIKNKRFDEIMRHVASNDEYVWLYGAPSALMHGDPEGLRQLFPRNDDGTERVVISLSDEQINAIMVDAGANVLMFCKTFVLRFKPHDESLATRIQELDAEFKVLVLKHKHGRDESVLVAIRVELAAPAMDA